MALYQLTIHWSTVNLVGSTPIEEDFPNDSVKDNFVEATLRNGIALPMASGITFHFPARSISLIESRLL